MAELNIAAKVDNLEEVISFIEGQLEMAGCPMKIMMQINIAVEEIFVNIAHYAYGDNEGNALIKTEIVEDKMKITFIDSGVPYNPLAKEDPDVTLPLEERPVGGLGIFMVKKIMDEMYYEYSEGKNILVIEKNL